MITFIIIFSLSIVMLLTVEAMDVECARPRRLRRNRGLARTLRVPFRLMFRNMLQTEAR